MAGISESNPCRNKHLSRSFNCVCGIPTAKESTSDSCNSCDANLKTSGVSSQSSIPSKPCNSTCDYFSTNPKHPKYQQYTARHESFIGWPSRYVLKTPEELSTAGFFYIGSADRVTCFQCGITLRDWNAEHDPIKEHEKYSKKCDFIKHLVQNPLTSEVKEITSIQRESNATSDDSISTSNCQSSRSNIDSEERNKVKVTELNSKGVDNQNDTMTISGPKSQRLASLIQENQRLKEEGICRLCGVQPTSILFLPCGHLVTCVGCAETVVDCNSCGKHILGTVKTYRA